MARKRHKPEEIVAKLRQVDVLTAQGQSIAATRYTYASVLDRSENQKLPDDYSGVDRKALTYTTPPLAADTEVLGAPVVKLTVSADAPDVDFFVYLNEVLPDGSSRPVTEGFIRASNRVLGRPTMSNLGLPFHPGLSHEQQPLPGAGVPVRLEFAMFPTARLFHKGSRIRLTVFSYDKDLWDSPSSAKPPQVVIYRNTAQFSYIDLPVMPNPERGGRSPKSSRGKRHDRTAR